MKRLSLGSTGLELSQLGFGASSIGAEFRPIDVGEALRCVNVALDRGINYIDTAAYYGRGMSEIMLGRVLPQIPRDSYLLSTKLGRYAPQHFDFSARRVREKASTSHSSGCRIDSHRHRLSVMTSSLSTSPRSSKRRFPRSAKGGRKWERCVSSASAAIR